MTQTTLPNLPVDVMGIPDAELPGVVRRLLHERRMSPLLRHIHEGLTDNDPVRRSVSHAALLRLGFVD